MAENNKETMAEELESRLEDLFSESEDVISDADIESQGAELDSPLTGLKSIILSIDWEISDQILDELRDEIGRLKPQFADDKAILVFLQMLESIGKYIKNHKANAHPGALKLLNDVYENLEYVSLSREGVDEREKQRRLSSLVSKFKQLKSDIKQSKAAARPEPVETASGQSMESGDLLAGKDMATLEPHEMFTLALEEIRKTIAAEFSALRAELKLWRANR